MIMTKKTGEGSATRFRPSKRPPKLKSSKINFESISTYFQLIFLEKTRVSLWGLIHRVIPAPVD